MAMWRPLSGASACSSCRGPRWQRCKRPARSSLSCCRGLSLLECLIACAVAAVLLAVTLPNLKPWLDRARVNFACSEFQRAILLARSEAIRRGARVDLVPIAAQDWRHGWLVLQDANNNQRLDRGEALIHRSELSIPGLSIEARLRDSGRAYLSFGPRGRPRSISSASVPQIGSLLFTVGSARRKLIISFLGRVRVCDPDPVSPAC